MSERKFQRMTQSCWANVGGTFVDKVVPQGWNGTIGASRKVLSLGKNVVNIAPHHHVKAIKMPFAPPKAGAVKSLTGFFWL